MKRYGLLLPLAVLLACVFGPSVHAEDNIQIRPLIYRESLRPGEVKRGFVDIANGSTSAVTVKISAKLFKQTSDDGTLSFYDRPFVKDAIVPDNTEVQLQAKDTVHLGFTVDSSKMPAGDVFATLFATTVHAQKPQQITPSAQVGTLLVFENGTPGPRAAQITQLSIPFLQVGRSLKGSISVKNPAKSDAATGFFPQISISSKPWGPSPKFEGKLVYAGRTRNVDFTTPSSQFGLFKISINANNASASTYVFLITGVWQWLFPLILAGIFASIAMVLIFRKRHSKKHSKKLH